MSQRDDLNLSPKHTYFDMMTEALNLNKQKPVDLARSGSERIQSHKQ